MNTDSVITKLTSDSQDILTALNANNNLSAMSGHIKLNRCFSDYFADCAQCVRARRSLLMTCGQQTDSNGSPLPRRGETALVGSSAVSTLSRSLSLVMSRRECTASITNLMLFEKLYRYLFIGLNPNNDEQKHALSN